MKPWKEKKLVALSYALVPLLSFLMLSSGTDNAYCEMLTVDALNRPAMATDRAETSVLLAIDRTGPRLVVVGERGLILNSEDNGSTWRQVAVPVSVTLTGIEFADDDNGWTFGHSGIVLKTEDGGRSWKKQLDGVQAAALAYQDAEDRLIDANEDEQTNDVLKRQLSFTRLLVDDGPDKPFLDMYCMNDREAFIVGAYNMIFKTVDGGHTWLPWLNRVENPRGMHLYAIEKIDDKLIIVGEQGLILRSDDGGESFYQLHSPYDGTFFGILALKNGAVLIYGLRGNAFISQDHGDHWQKIDTGVKLGITAAVESPDGTLFFTTQSGNVLVSHDGGNTMKKQKIEAPFAFSDLLQTLSRKLVLVGMRGVKVVPPVSTQTGAVHRDSLIAYGDKK